MGLDMKLSATKYFSKNFNGKQAEQIKKVVKEITPESPVTVKFEVGYWRKANHIHRWFVENIQEGVDNCENFYASREKLKELLKVCKDVEADHEKAKELLPISTGFFFGGTEYEDWYFEDIHNTIDIIEKALLLDISWDFEYHSSW